MSLHHKCVLADLTITSLTTSRTDRGITADVIRRTSAETDAGRWVSRLWPKEALDPINQHDSATRKLHQGLTLPWLDNSKRILPTAAFHDYMDIMRQRKPEREQLVKTHFLDDFHGWVQKARLLRGTAFNSAEYPDYHSAVASFSFKIEAEPVPHRDDFRVTLAAGDMDEIQAGLEDRLATAARIARNDLLARITEPLVRIVERLSDPDAKFRDSLIGNLQSVVRSIPGLNVTADPEIETVRRQLEATLCKLDPDTLRESTSGRTRAASTANQILATMAPWMDHDAAA